MTQPLAREQERTQRTLLDSMAQRLKDAVASIQDSESFKRYLRAQARFHHYSFRNTLLIISQFPNASHVAGYEAWRQLGRQVRKGETGIRIYAPVIKKAENKDESTVAGFRAAAVFDISQTDGDDLLIDVPTLNGTEGDDLYHALAQLAQAQGLGITHEAPTTCSRTANGCYLKKEKMIYVKPQAQLQMVKTLAHELGHANDYLIDLAEEAELETVAEGVAFMVLAHFGLDSGSYSFGYIADWNGSADGRETLTTCMGRIQKIAHAIIEGATPYLVGQTISA